MMTGIKATVRMGYSGYDHLIDSSDETAATDAVAGVDFRRASDALEAARKAFRASADSRCATPRIQVDLRTARGDRITVG